MQKSPVAPHTFFFQYCCIYFIQLEYRIVGLPSSFVACVQP